MSEPVYRGPKSDHFNGKRFFNYGRNNTRNLGHVLKWMLTRQRKPWTQTSTPDAIERPLEEVTDHIRITHVNHSTFLIQCNGINILTDPVWSERASPFSWAGPKRMKPPAFPMTELPRIDLVLVSHNHYDHLDIDTLKILHKQYQPKFLVPLGVNRLLAKHAISNVAPMDWWDVSSEGGNATIQAVPAQHSSARGMFDKDQTLWCGFTISIPNGKIYFAGDTGYDKGVFARIHERCGSFKVSLLPIGAYQPRWFMKPLHCSPAEAVQIHIDVKSEISIASHFGTFPLADEGQTEPVEDLRIALQENRISEDKFIVPRPGHPLDFT